MQPNTSQDQAIAKLAEGIVTAQGKIVPVRDISINDSGEVILISSTNQGNHEHLLSKSAQCLAE